MRNMFRSVIAATLLLAPITVPAQPSSWKKQASRVTIMRDQYGIAHVYGASDADAVFGMVYAQAEDDFNRVETNYITATLGVYLSLYNVFQSLLAILGLTSSSD